MGSALCGRVTGELVRRLGSGALVNGSAQVALEPTFAATVNTGADYRVFPVPNADCKGLYIAEKTATGFTVRELGGGTSNIAFDYRIVARRKGYENVRLEDVTDKRAVLAALNRQLTNKNDPATRKQREKMMRPQFSAGSQAGSTQPGPDGRQAGHRVVSAVRH